MQLLRLGIYPFAGVIYSASMTSLFAAIDCGTSAVKAGVFDASGRLVSLASRGVPCVHHADGRVTQDARSLRAAALGTLKRAMAANRIAPRRIASLCVTNQRATVVCLDRHGEPLLPAISWQDMSGAPQIAALRRRIPDADYYGMTGLPNNAVFSLSKILHLRKTAPAAFAKTARFALVQDYVLRALGCGDYVADHSNASLTGMMDIRRFRWSAELLDAAGVDETRLPSLVPSGRAVGRLSASAAARCGLAAGTPLVSGGGDQQCAGVGAGVVRPGLCSITMGTAGVSFCHVDRVVLDPRRRITCCAHAVPGCWNLEGLQSTAGDSLRWAGRHLAGAKRLDDGFLAEVARVPAGARGVLFFPYLAGAAAPHWIAEATAAFVGLKYSHDTASLVRAVIEGVVFENLQILDVFASLRVPVREIRLTGGLSTSRLWNQIQADVYDRPVVPLANPHATLLGAAILGAFGVGAVPSLQAAAEAMVRFAGACKSDARRSREYRSVYRKFVKVMETFKSQGLFEVLA